MQPVINKPLKQYRIAKGWRIFIFIFMPPLTLLFLWMGLIMPFYAMENREIALFFVPLGLAMATFLLYGLADTIKGRLQVYHDRLVQIGPLKTRELLFSNIKGYRVTDHYTFIYAKEGKPKQLKISSYLGNLGEIQQWLYHNYPNLDVVKAIEEEQQILADDTIGSTAYEREEKLKGARKISKVLNWGGGLLAICLLFLPLDYELTVAIGLLYPLPVVMAVFFYRGLIKVAERQGSAYPSIAGALLFPSFALALRALLDINLLELSPLLATAIAMTILPLMLLLIGSREISHLTQKKEMGLLIIIIMMFFTYGFGGSTLINSLYDKAEPMVYDAEVLDKRISKGKTTTYYLELSAWGPRTEAEEVSVDEDLYDYLEAGDSVQVYLKPGLLQAPWYFVLPLE